MNKEQMDMIYFGDYSYYLFPGKWSHIRDDDIFRCEIQPDVNMEELEQVLKNTNNTQRIIVKSWHDDAIALIIEGYVEIKYIHKNFDSTIGYEIINGVRTPVLSDTIELELRRMGAETRFNHIQSNLEYLAIMSDVDIDEEE